MKDNYRIRIGPKFTFTPLYYAGRKKQSGAVLRDVHGKAAQYATRAAAERQARSLKRYLKWLRIDDWEVVVVDPAPF